MIEFFKKIENFILISKAILDPCSLEITDFVKINNFFFNL